MSEKKAAIIIGAGDATGGAVARRFAKGGYVACVTRRNAEKLDPLLASISAAGGEARGFGSDARDEAQVIELFSTVEREVGPVEVLVFNIGANVNFPIAEMTERVYRKVWEMAALAGFLTGREAARGFVQRNRLGTRRLDRTGGCGQCCHEHGKAGARHEPREAATPGRRCDRQACAHAQAPPSARRRPIWRRSRLVGRPCAIASAGSVKKRRDSRRASRRAIDSGVSS